MLFLLVLLLALFVMNYVYLLVYRRFERFCLVNDTRTVIDMNDFLVMRNCHPLTIRSGYWYPLSEHRQEEELLS